MGRSSDFPGDKNRVGTVVECIAVVLAKGRRICEVWVAVDDVVRVFGRTKRRENGIHLSSLPLRERSTS